MRKITEIQEVESELYDRLAYAAFLGREEQIARLEVLLVADGTAGLLGEVLAVEKSRWERICAGAKRIEEKYGRESLTGTVKNQHDFGALYGKVTALRWVLGKDWDDLGKKSK